MDILGARGTGIQEMANDLHELMKKKDEAILERYVMIRQVERELGADCNGCFRDILTAFWNNVFG